MCMCVFMCACECENVIVNHQLCVRANNMCVCVCVCVCVCASFTPLCAEERKVVDIACVKCACVCVCGCVCVCVCVQTDHHENECAHTENQKIT